MRNDDDWSALLDSHPIFSHSRPFKNEESLELSTKTLPSFSTNDPTRDNSAPSGRRQVMCMKDADLIVATESEIRMTSLGDVKSSAGSEKSYKVLHTPNVQFEVHQICLSPNGKLLAVAGAFQVAVVVLPRMGYSKLVTSRIDCKSIQVGQYYHATSSSPPVAKIEWHPWGDAGSTLLVMTVDGSLREYDISVDPEEPQQTLHFVPEKKRGAYVAEDDTEREVASFSLGRGKADWGPLTVYAVMRSGDVYAICPYLPHNASIPSSYVHALECYVGAKQEFLKDERPTEDESFSTLYDLQRKYVNGLLKQLPPGTAFPSTSRSISMHPPRTIKNKLLRQGPFLMQPSPIDLETSIYLEATDIVYVALSSESDEDEDSRTERLGVVLVVFQDGRVDVCLDLEKVEAKWESKQAKPRVLPMFAVYETIDLGLISALSRASPPGNADKSLDLLQANHPVFQVDPIHDDTTYVYHAFGVHVLNLGPVLQNFAAALKDDENDDALSSALQKPSYTSVQPILSTFSVQRRSSNPVVAVTVPNDVYLTYSIFILTSRMGVISFPLNLRTSTDLDKVEESQRYSTKLPPLPPMPPAYIPLLATKPFETPEILKRQAGFPRTARLALPDGHTPNSELQVTPNTLRYLGTVVERFTAEVRDVQLAYRALAARIELQRQEHGRQQEKCRDMIQRIDALKSARRRELQGKLKSVQDVQGPLLSKMDRTLQTLINQASPELNDHETKWFEELRRMKGQVAGQGRYDQTSLSARTQVVRNELDRLFPSLAELRIKERKAKAQQSEGDLGFSQSFAYGKRSEAERVKLDEAVKQITRIAGRLDIGLGNPPKSVDRPVQ